MTIIKTISVSEEFSNLAKEYKLSWSEAARIGLGIMLGDKGIKPYDNNLNLQRKVEQFVIEADKLRLRVEELENGRN